ncbi:MAG TPA: hypothetical protein VE844_00510, partial [Gammaproteobacteria bacterium]|nr:hypothetical protein [Gammaproteobacteria bacterium]
GGSHGCEEGIKVLTALLEQGDLLFSVRAFLRRTWSALRGFFTLLICLLACCQRVKNKIILPLDNATNRLTCEEYPTSFYFLLTGLDLAEP